MYRLQRGAVLAVILVFMATSSMAAENAFKSLFEDVFYGALSGGLVGAAVMAFSQQPGKHFEYIAYGAASGVLVGATYGAVATTRSLAELKNGEVSFSMPSVMPEIRESSPGHTSVVAMSELFRGTF